MLSSSRRSSEADTLRAAARFKQDQLNQATQAMWDALGILGFDLDGEPTPRASLTRGVKPFAEMFLAHMREARADYDRAVNESRP